MEKLNTGIPVLFASFCMLCATPPVVAQKKPLPSQEKTQKTRQTTRANSPLGKVRILSDKEADALVSRLKKLVLSKKARKKPKWGRKKKKSAAPVFNPLITRLEEVEAMSLVQHAKLVPILKRVIKTDPSDRVRAIAAYALQAQPKKLVLALATKLMKDRNIRRAGSIAGPLITIMSYHGAKQSAFGELYKRFMDLGASAQIAIMESVGKRKDWDGLGFLLKHLDPPQPAWVDDPNNPPASYWKKRWERWARFKPALQKSLKTLVGKDFNKKRDVLKYIDSQGGLDKFIKKRGG